MKIKIENCKMITKYDYNPAFITDSGSFINNVRRKVACWKGDDNVDKLPCNERLCMTIEEAASYSLIGEDRLRQIIANEPYLPWVMRVGNRTRVKRVPFEKWVLEQVDV